MRSHISILVSSSGLKQFDEIWDLSFPFSPSWISRDDEIWISASRFLVSVSRFLVFIKPLVRCLNESVLTIFVFISASLLSDLESWLASHRNDHLGFSPNSLGSRVFVSSSWRSQVDEISETRLYFFCVSIIKSGRRELGPPLFIPRLNKFRLTRSEIWASRFFRLD